MSCYLHEIIIEAVEVLIKEGEPFSAWDVTQWVRECLLDYFPGDISDCTSFTNKEGDERYNVEHSRVKNLVHLYLKNYNPNKIQQAHGSKYITYTPVNIGYNAVIDYDSSIKNVSPLSITPAFPPLSITPNSTGQGVSFPAPSTVTKINTSDKQLLESALEILKRNGLI